MGAVRYFVAGVLIIALVLLGAKLVAAQSQPVQYYGPGGGMIRGYILGFDMYEQLEPIEWASVYANNGQQSFVAYSSGGGYFEMFVPSGNYNVTVVEPGYKPYSSAVSVSNGSSSTIDFYLEQSHVPVPEFPVGIASIITIATLSGALLAIRRTKRKR